MDEDYFPNICLSYTPNNYKRRCSFDKRYSFPVCIAYDNFCDDVTFEKESDATEEACNTLVEKNFVDLNKEYICILKRDKSGCTRILKKELELIQKKEEEGKKLNNEKNNENGNGNGNGNNKGNSGGKRHQIIFGLLVSLIVF